MGSEPGRKLLLQSGNLLIKSLRQWAVMGGGLATLPRNGVTADPA